MPHARERVTITSIKFRIDIIALIDNADVKYQHSNDRRNDTIDDFNGRNTVDRRRRASWYKVQFVWQLLLSSVRMAFLNYGLIWRSIVAWPSNRRGHVMPVTCTTGAHVTEQSAEVLGLLRVSTLV